MRFASQKATRVHAESGRRCVTAMPRLSVGHAAPPRVRVAARVGQGRGHKLRATTPCSSVNSASDPSHPGSSPSDDGDSCRGLTLPVPPVGRRAQFPPSLPLEGACAGGEDASNYTNPPEFVSADQPSELHVVGVYESDCTGSEWPVPCQPVTVVVQPRPKPVVLVLSAYEAVTWHVDVRPGATVSRVLTSGYLPQTVTGVPADIVSAASDLGALAWGWEVTQNQRGGGYWQMMASIRATTGLVETSFQGCYTGARFGIPYASGPPTTCGPSPVTGDETTAQEAVDFPTCADVAAESVACLSFVEGGLALIGTDSGTVCLLGAADANVHPNPSGASLGWLGEVLYQCTVQEGLVRTDLRSGARERLEMPCEAVTDDDGSLLVSPGFLTATDSSSWGRVYRVNGYAGLVAADATPLSGLTLRNSRFTAHGGLLYSAWHATDTIDVTDLATGVPVRQVTLAGYDGWILGLDVTDDGRLFVAGMDDESTTLMTFDAATGACLGQHRIGSSWGAAGLACRAGGG